MYFEQSSRCGQWSNFASFKSRYVSSSGITKYMLIIRIKTVGTYTGNVFTQEEIAPDSSTENKDLPNSSMRFNLIWSAPFGRYNRKQISWNICMTKIKIKTNEEGYHIELCVFLYDRKPAYMKHTRRKFLKKWETVFPKYVFQIKDYKNIQPRYIYIS